MRNVPSEQTDGAHSGKLPPETFVVLGGGGKPHTVVGAVIVSVAENEDDLLLDIDGEAPKHRPRHGYQGRERVQDELMWHSPAGLACQDARGPWIATRATTCSGHCE